MEETITSDRSTVTDRNNVGVSMGHFGSSQEELPKGTQTLGKGKSLPGASGTTAEASKRSYLEEQVGVFQQGQSLRSRRAVVWLQGKGGE